MIKFKPKRWLKGLPTALMALLCWFILSWAMDKTNTTFGWQRIVACDPLIIEGCRYDK